MSKSEKRGTPTPKLSERFYEMISLPAQLLALMVDAALAHDTLRHALSGSDDSISILVAVSIAAVIVECSSQAAVQLSKGERFASRALLGVSLAVALIILVLRVLSGVGSTTQATTAFAIQSTSWSEYLTNAVISLLQSACVCATVMGVYYTRISDIKSHDREELLERRSEQEARRLCPSAYDVGRDIEAAEDYLAAVYARARSIIRSKTATMSPDIADVYELSSRQDERVASAPAEEHESAPRSGGACGRRCHRSRETPRGRRRVAIRSRPRGACPREGMPSSQGGSRRASLLALIRPRGSDTYLRRGTVPRVIGWCCRPGKSFRVPGLTS